MKIDEIKQAIKNIQLNGWSEYPKQNVTYDWLRYLIGEVERLEKELERVKDDKDLYADLFIKQQLEGAKHETTSADNPRTPSC